MNFPRMIHNQGLGYHMDTKFLIFVSPYANFIILMRIVVQTGVLSLSIIYTICRPGELWWASELCSADVTSVSLVSSVCSSLNCS